MEIVQKMKYKTKFIKNNNKNGRWVVDEWLWMGL